jgi:hypothetical protein
MSGSEQREKTALKPFWAPGDYLGTWVIPSLNGTPANVPGLLTLEADRAPQGVAYGGVPRQVSTPAGLTFPHSSQHDQLVFILANGGSVLLTGATLRHGMNEDARVYASVAIISARDLRDANMFESARIQIEYLDAIAGIPPLTMVKIPRSGSGTYSAESSGTARETWTDDGATVSLGFQGMLHSVERYQFHLGFSPIVEVEAAQPAPFEMWKDDWIEPLRKIVSIAVGRPAVVTYAEVTLPVPEGEHAWGSRCQVFGTAITQAPYESKQKAIQSVESPLQLKPDNVSLLGLTRKWQAMVDDHHPLVETYGAMLHAADQHPRSRLLLLLQAIEGSFGYETKPVFEAALAKHTAKRTEILTAIDTTLTKAQRDFLRRNLGKWPQAGLESAINWLRKELPGDIRKRLDDAAVIQETRAEPHNATSAADALRVIRNNLAHGKKGYDIQDLHEVVRILERIVRAHALQLLGCPDAVVTRVLKT